MRRGWFMNKRRPLLHKQMGLLEMKGQQLCIQFSNMALPHDYTHTWTGVPTACILELQDYNEERQEVTLSVAQKMYRRKVRNGKFDFHGEEYAI